MVVLEPYARGGPWPARLVTASLGLLVLSLVSMAGAGPAYRLELIALDQAFELLRLGALLGVAAALLGLLTLGVGAWYRRPRAALVGILVLLAVAVTLLIPAQYLQRAQAVPPIHDITTDTADPPPFVALAAARAAAPNAVGYPRAFAAQQQRAYPDLAPLRLQAPPARILETAATLMHERGWEIAAVNATTLEATAATRWFGFRDDLVLRLTEDDDGVRVDMRSASRLGRSDLGTNAARIQAFLSALESRLGRD